MKNSTDALIDNETNQEKVADPFADKLAEISVESKKIVKKTATIYKYQVDFMTDVAQKRRVATGENVGESEIMRELLELGIEAMKKGAN